MNRGAERARGLAIIMTAVLILSPDALLMRLVDLDHWTLAFWRSGMMSITLGVTLIAIYRRRTGKAFRDIGVPGAVICVVHAYTSISFVFAILHTAVANVFIIVSAAPLFAAIFSRIDARTRTWPYGGIDKSESKELTELRVGCG